MDLFTIEANLQVVRILSSDVLLDSDNIRVFTQSILKHEDMYPGISAWLRNKVLPGIQNNTRIAYLGFYNDTPVVTAVAKVGQSTKFCHLHLDKEIQDKNLGEIFFSLMVLDVRHIADGIHFTLPEGLWEREKDFFNSFGFANAFRSPMQYRKGEDELMCRSTFDQVWAATLEKIPKLIDLHSLDQDNVSNGLLMSIRPRFTNKILNGDKLIEIRKKFNHKWAKKRVTLYSTSPTKCVMGYASIHNIVSDSPRNIWEQFGSVLGCTRKEFDSYTQGLAKVYAIQLVNVNPYKNPIPLTQLSWFLDTDLTPPQSYASLRQNKNWLNAISIADLLQGKFSTVIQVY